MCITKEPINVANTISQKPDSSCGAVASFIGVVRNHHQGQSVKKIYYECYESMADKQIKLIIADIKQKYKIHKIIVIHRVGWLYVGEAAIVIVVHSAHRDEAFSACREVIDVIKKKVPIWKKEYLKDGTCEWVAPQMMVK